MKEKINTMQKLVQCYEIDRLINAAKDGPKYGYSGFILWGNKNIVVCNPEYADVCDEHFFSNKDVLEYLKEFL